MIIYSGHNPPWRQENRLPTFDEIQEISGYIGQTENPSELENLGYAAIEATLTFYKIMAQKSKTQIIFQFWKIEIKRFVKEYWFPLSCVFLYLFIKVLV